MATGTQTAAAQNGKVRLNLGDSHFQAGTAPAVRLEMVHQPGEGIDLCAAVCSVCGRVGQPRILTGDLAQLTGEAGQLALGPLAERPG